MSDRRETSILIAILIVLCASVTALINEDKAEVWKVVTRWLAGICAGGVVLIVHMIADTSIMPTLIAAIILSAATSAIWSQIPKWGTRFLKNKGDGL